MADGVFVSFLANVTIALCWALKSEKSSPSSAETQLSAAAADRPSSSRSSRFKPAAWCPGQYVHRLQREATTAAISRSALLSGESPFMHCMYRAAWDSIVAGLSECIVITLSIDPSRLRTRSKALVRATSALAALLPSLTTAMYGLVSGLPDVLM